MNVIWTTLLLVTVTTLCFTSPEEVLTIFIGSAESALSTALKLTAVYVVWLGLFRIAEDSNLLDFAVRRLKKFNSFLYGNVSKKTLEYITLNNASNLLGIGNASTPSAVKAIAETEKGAKLSKHGAMLFVINANGLQLVPTTVIGMRAVANSVSPSDIVLPTLISTLVTTLIGIVLVKVFYK